MGSYISLFKPLLLCTKSRYLFCLSHYSGALPRIWNRIDFLYSVLLWGSVYLNMNCLVVYPTYWDPLSTRGCDASGCMMSDVCHSILMTSSN